MAFLPSNWAKATPLATLNNPPVVGTFTPSGWGRTTAALTDPAPPPSGGGSPFSPSNWMKATATLSNPAAPSGYTPSGWGRTFAAVGLVVAPQDPVVDVEPETPVEITAYIASNQPILRDALSKAGDSPVPLVFAGSSTTLGTGASSPANSFSYLVLATMQALYPGGAATESTMQMSNSATFSENLAAGIHGYNLGQGGGVTAADFFTSAERTNVGLLDPAAIFLMIGANDFANGVTPATYKTNLATVLTDLRTKAPNAVLFVVNTFQRLDVITPAYPWVQYRTKLVELAAESPSDTIFLDVGDEFITRGVPGTDPLDLVGPDAIHATDAGHALIADTIIRDLEGITPVDSWQFTKVSGPAVTLVVDGNKVSFVSPSVKPPTGTTVTIGVTATKGSIVSSQRTIAVNVRPNTVWQNTSGFTYAGARPPVQSGALVN